MMFNLLGDALLYHFNVLVVGETFLYRTKDDFLIEGNVTIIPNRTKNISVVEDVYSS